MEWQGITWKDDDPAHILLQKGIPQCPIPDAATVMAEAQTLMIRHYDIPHVDMLYTNKRWVGYIESDKIWFSNHDTALCVALWRAWGAWATTQYQRAGFASESGFVAYVAQQLEHEGWHCRKEAYTRYGRLDLLATREDLLWIIEAKLSMSATDVTRAVGQLLCGREAYPDAVLWFATPAVLQDRWAPLFARYNIRLLEGLWTKTL